MPRRASMPASYLEHRPDEADLDRFRRETDTPASTGRGLSSYPHPRLMPDFWEYPTVSMGLGPILSIYQARFNKYLEHRRIDDAAGSRVWCFVGDGECDEPETLGSISLAAREHLDNLTWVINCNLQRSGRPGAWQRQDHPGAGGHIPRCRLERDQGDLGRPG
ncbi:MAG: hypothetical protein R2789_08430 [Microthrixaceae bacterium]